MKCLFPIPEKWREQLKEAAETGIGCQIVSVALKDGRRFDQVLASECCIIEVRGYAEIPFAPHEVEIVNISHERWNFREGSDSRNKMTASVAA